MTVTSVDRLLYVEEVAEMIRKTPSALRYMIYAGTAPRSAKVGGRRMFKESDVLAWIEEQFNKAAS
ncbi:MAG: helix-turn-helix transcriptional regulator [Actinomycetota bacterium]